MDNRRRSLPNIHDERRDMRVGTYPASTRERIGELIQRLHSDDYPHREICDVLNDADTTTSTGLSWTPNRLKYYVRGLRNLDNLDPI